MKTIKRVLFILLFLFLISSLTKNLFEYRKNYSFYEDFKNEFDQTQQKNTSLKTAILKNSDPNQIEKIIRNKLGLGKPNEVAVIIPLPTPTIPHTTPTPQPPYKQWADVFFKH